MPRYIDVDELLRKPPDIHDYYDESGEKDCAHGYTIATIKSATTLSPDEVRGVGEWIEKEVYNLEVTTIEQMQSASCSVCGKIHTTPFSYYFSKFNYCPNCGAKMEVSEDA